MLISSLRFACSGYSCGRWFLCAVSRSPLFPACFEAFESGSDSFQDVAQTAISNAVNLSRDLAHHTPLREAIMPRVFALEPQFDAVMAAGDPDSAKLLAESFLEASEVLATAWFDGRSPHSTCSPLVRMLLGDPATPKFNALEIMLKLSGQEDEDIVDLTFHFWYTFSTEIYDMDSPNRWRIGDLEERLEHLSDHKEVAEATAELTAAKAAVAQARSLRDQACAATLPFYMMYLDHLLVHARCEDSLTGLLGSKSDTVEFRTRICDDYHRRNKYGILLDTNFIAGTEVIVQHLWEKCQGVEWNVRASHAARARDTCIARGARVMQLAARAPE